MICCGFSVFFLCTFVPFFIFTESWTLDKEQQTLLSVFSLSKVLQFRKQRDWAKIQNHRRKMANSNIYLGVYSTCQMKFTFCPRRSSLTSLNKISSYFLKDYLPKQNKDYSHYWATHKVFSFSISYITSNVKNILNQNNIHSFNNTIFIFSPGTVAKVDTAKWETEYQMNSLHALFKEKKLSWLNPFVFPFL